MILIKTTPTQVEEKATFSLVQNEEDFVKKDTTPEEIRNFFIEYHKQKQISEGDIQSEDLEEESIHQPDGCEDDEAMHSDTPKVIPVHVKSVMQVCPIFYDIFLSNLP